MNADTPVPRQVKVVDSATLVWLEERAAGFLVNQRVNPVWLRANTEPEGRHYLWPALWNSTPHRPELPRQLRCELLITLRGGERVMSLLDMLPDDFTPLPRVTSRDEGMGVRRWLDRAPTILQWVRREGVDPGELW
ncbi:hypothetical protein [Streptomyces sp. NPDC059491]|uniref:hypothetical protein n=1 Tax=unclassified Streptomyces TaxID=2593676 RepID=UPI0036CC2646